MKYNHAMAEREYKREWKAAKLEMRKAGMQRKQIMDTLFQESHSMHSPDLEDDIGELIDQVERSDLLSWLRSLTEQQYRVVELYTEGYATSDIAQILSLDNQTVLNHKNRAVQKYKSIIPKVSKG